MNLKLKAAIALSVLSLLPVKLTAQQDATVTVDTGTAINILTNNALGVVVPLSDSVLTSPDLPKLLVPGGLHTIRYPDGADGVGDRYHWSTYRQTKWGNSNPPNLGYLSPQNDFGHFALQLDKIGSALVTVNYGSNMAGNVGGDPMEAAAWVAYANGDPASGTTLGKDSTGHDWSTVGFWASMRAGEPLTDDDGYNFLRIHHPAPLHIQLWEIGNQVYNNGYYGDLHKSETDWHAPYPESMKDNGKRHKDAHLSPNAYAANVTAFSQAMKAVDPTIQVGVSMVQPAIDYAWAPDWDQEVLQGACKDINFVSLQWIPGGDVLPPDWKHMDEDKLLNAPESNLGKMMPELLNLYKKHCPAGHTPKVVFSQIGIQTWPTIDDGQVAGLFSAHVMALLTEMGSVNNNWNELHQNSMFTADNKPLPAFFGIQMLHIVAFQPGDQFLQTAVKGTNLVAHATYRRDGVFGVMLINKDAKSAQRVKVVLNGANLQSAGIRFDYGGAQAKASTGPAKSELKLDGNSVIVTVPPYSIVDLLVPQTK